MKTMYDYMSESTVTDEDGDFYPDLWSLDWSKKVETTDLVSEWTVRSLDLPKLWITQYNMYGTVDLLDLLKYLNNVEYTTDLIPGEDVLFYPCYNDLFKYGENLQKLQNEA